MSRIIVANTGVVSAAIFVDLNGASEKLIKAVTGVSHIVIRQIRVYVLTTRNEFPVEKQPYWQDEIDIETALKPTYKPEQLNGEELEILNRI